MQKCLGSIVVGSKRLKVKLSRHARRGGYDTHGFRRVKEDPQSAVNTDERRDARREEDHRSGANGERREGVSYVDLLKGKAMSKPIERTMWVPKKESW